MITIDQYIECDCDQPTELVRGRIEMLEFTTPRHGTVCANVGRIIGNYLDEQDLGHLVLGSGIITARNPDTVGGGDVWFISYEKQPRGSLGDNYLTNSPDFVIEVLSMADRWPRVLQKVAEYLNMGVPVVCVLDPGNETARLYFIDQPEIVLTADDELTFPNQLPGFSVRVGSLFE